MRQMVKWCGDGYRVPENLPVNDRAGSATIDELGFALAEAVSA